MLRHAQIVAPVRLICPAGMPNEFLRRPSRALIAASRCLKLCRFVRQEFRSSSSLSCPSTITAGVVEFDMQTAYLAHRLRCCRGRKQKSQVTLVRLL